MYYRDGNNIASGRDVIYRPYASARIQLAYVVMFACLLYVCHCLFSDYRPLQDSIY